MRPGKTSITGHTFCPSGKVDSDDFSHKKWALACANAQNQTHYLSYKPQSARGKPDGVKTHQNACNAFLSEQRIKKGTQSGPFFIQHRICTIQTATSNRQPSDRTSSEAETTRTSIRSSKVRKRCTTRLLHGIESFRHSTKRRKRNYMRCGAEIPRMPSVCSSTTRTASHRARRAFFRPSSSAFRILQFV